MRTRLRNERGAALLETAITIPIILLIAVGIGATLAAAPGTVFLFEKNDSTKVDPEQFHGGVELVVRGTLSADNAVFRFPGRAGGIVVDGGRARLSGEAFNITDRSRASVRDMLGAVACSTGYQGEIRFVPVAEAAAKMGPFAECLALVRLRGEVGRRLPGDSVRLEPLGQDDVLRLVTALAPWCSTTEMRDRVTRRVAFETGGNPFLAVTLLQALTRASTMRGDVIEWPRRGSTIDSPLPISVPDLVRMAVVARVSVLDAADLLLLRAASVSGSALDPEVFDPVQRRSHFGHSCVQNPRKKAEMAPVSSQTPGAKHEYLQSRCADGNPRPDYTRLRKVKRTI